MKISPRTLHKRLQELDQKQHTYQTIKLKKHFASPSLNAMPENVGNPFVPFVKERDQLGRLLVENKPRIEKRKRPLRIRTKSNTDSHTINVEGEVAKQHHSSTTLRTFSKQVHYRPYVLSHPRKSPVRSQVCLFTRNDDSIPPLGTYTYDDRILKPSLIRDITFPKLRQNEVNSTRNIKVERNARAPTEIYKSVPVVSFSKMRGRKGLFSGKYEDEQKNWLRRRDGEMSERAIELLLKLRKQMEIPKVDVEKGEELEKVEGEAFERAISGLHKSVKKKLQ
eukprot:TRINITY_DN142_c0_g1_i4.p1 TRINITY_DN142_c0_g1~~TRINITY_DN142_c0_g1_i4.p1  ORF type:complete len:301 (+),score=18.22 TRINITY_DN142_c0_g1_i4:65-904(+)